VANASRSQRRELETNGIATLESLARCAEIPFKPKHGSREALEKASKDDPAVAGRILGEAYLRSRISK
jgi:hypothetical protein